MCWGAHACGKNNFFSLFTFRRTTKFAKIEIFFMVEIACPPPITENTLYYLLATT